MRDELEMLLKLEKLRSLKSQQALAKIQAQEDQLRDQIQTLNEHRRDSREVSAELVPMRAIGADILWQSWIDRTQKELSSDLARVMARKLPVLQRARKNIGRREVVAEMKEQTAARQDREEEQKRLATALEVSAIQAALSRRQ